MRIAVIADIHGNLEAFRSVLADIDAAVPPIDHIISLGDNIGYGAESEQVMTLIRDRSIPSILGNHELAVKHPRFYKWFNPQVQATLKKTFAGLSPETIDDILRMAPTMIFDGCRFVHGFPPASTVLYLYQMSERKICRAFRRINERYCFIGHTHDLNLVRVSGKSALYMPFSRGVTLLDPGFGYLINAGSVGQPRDGDNRAKYIIWEPSLGSSFDSSLDSSSDFSMDSAANSSVEVRCIRYDIEAAARKILDAGYPEYFATRLR